MKRLIDYQICNELWFDMKGKKDTQMKIIQTYEWEMLNTIIELCLGGGGGVRKRLAQHVE